MKNKIRISVLCICMLLTVLGCNGGWEKQTGSDMLAAGQDTETENELLAGEDMEQDEAAE